uniref:HAUS augmin-like complex subunit 3 N-terminal domain-containing protein n=1 Tax=Aegilops tauschii subsp. strangulata TaxID=200361 RepID=A0A453BKD0_AEGTS
MSAKQLCDALAAAGFDSGDPLDPESLDWAFSSKETTPAACSRGSPPAYAAPTSSPPPTSNSMISLN